MFHMPIFKLQVYFRIYVCKTELHQEKAVETHPASNATTTALHLHS